MRTLLLVPSRHLYMNIDGKYQFVKNPVCRTFMENHEIGDKFVVTCFDPVTQITLDYRAVVTRYDEDGAWVNLYDHV